MRLFEQRSTQPLIVTKALFQKLTIYINYGSSHNIDSPPTNIEVIEMVGLRW